MGGIFSSPAPPPPPPPVEEEPLVDETKDRLDAIKRQRRGRAATIKTSERGLVRPNANAVQKKNLLGE